MAPKTQGEKSYRNARQFKSCHRKWSWEYLTSRCQFIDYKMEFFFLLFPFFFFNKNKTNHSLQQRGKTPQKPRNACENIHSKDYLERFTFYKCIYFFPFPAAVYKTLTVTGFLGLWGEAIPRHQRDGGAAWWEEASPGNLHERKSGEQLVKTKESTKNCILQGRPWVCRDNMLLWDNNSFFDCRRDGYGASELFVWFFFHQK